MHCFFPIGYNQLFTSLFTAWNCASSTLCTYTLQQLHPVHVHATAAPPFARMRYSSSTLCTYALQQLHPVHVYPTSAPP